MAVGDGAGCATVGGSPAQLLIAHRERARRALSDLCSRTGHGARAPAGGDSRGRPTDRGDERSWWAPVSGSRSTRLVAGPASRPVAADGESRRVAKASRRRGPRRARSTGTPSWRARERTAGDTPRTCAPAHAGAHASKRPQASSTFSRAVYTPAVLALAVAVAGPSPDPRLRHSAECSYRACPLRLSRVPRARERDPLSGWFGLTRRRAARPHQGGVTSRPAARARRVRQTGTLSRGPAGHGRARRRQGGGACLAARF